MYYPKVKTLFKLIPQNSKASKWSATSGEILPETSPLHHLPINELVFTEKIDGVNMGIVLDFMGDVEFCQAKNHICEINSNNDKYFIEMSNLISQKVNGSRIEELKNTVVYGELCGPKIQKGGNYFDERKFLIFDIYNMEEDQFFRWEAVKHFSEKLGIDTVPEIQYTKPNLEVENVKDFILDLKSAYNSNFLAEGMIVRWKDDILSIRRWIAKIRRKDFR